MAYLLLKWLHILSAALLFGTGVGSAWYLLLTVMSRNVQAIAVVSRILVVTDWLFTGVTMLIQPASGFYLAHLAGYPLHSRWLQWSIDLFLLALLCWLPVVWIQMRLRGLAVAAAGDNTALPARFWTYFRCWIALGIPALLAFLAVFYLMVAKPA